MTEQFRMKTNNMKKIIKKVLIETLEDKKLQMAYVYLSNYLNSLEEFVDKKNDIIYLHEHGDEYAKVCIDKKYSECLVRWLFWDKFSKEFSLQGSEVELLINIWVENTYKLKGINTRLHAYRIAGALKIPTN